MLEISALQVSWFDLTPSAFKLSESLIFTD